MFLLSFMVWIFKYNILVDFYLQCILMQKSGERWAFLWSSISWNLLCIPLLYQYLLYTVNKIWITFVSWKWMFFRVRVMAQILKAKAVFLRLGFNFHTNIEAQKHLLLHFYESWCFLLAFMDSRHMVINIHTEKKD